MMNNAWKCSAIVLVACCQVLCADVWVYNTLDSQTTVEWNGKKKEIPAERVARLESHVPISGKVSNGDRTSDFEISSAPSAVIINGFDGVITISALEFPGGEVVEKSPESLAGGDDVVRVKLKAFSARDGFSSEQIRGRLQKANSKLREHKIEFVLVGSESTPAKTAQLLLAKMEAEQQEGVVSIGFGAPSSSSDMVGERPLGSSIIVGDSPRWSEKQREDALLKSLVIWLGGFEVPDDRSVMSLAKGRADEKAVIDLINAYAIHFVASEVRDGTQFHELSPYAKSHLSGIYRNHLWMVPADARVHRLLLELDSENGVQSIAEGMGLRVQQNNISREQWSSLRDGLYPKPGELPWLEINWGFDLSDGMDRARREDKPILFFSTADGNPAGRC